jgi:hypothetical protein
VLKSLKENYKKKIRPPTVGTSAEWRSEHRPVPSSISLVDNTDGDLEEDPDKDGKRVSKYTDMKRNSMESGKNPSRITENSGQLFA